MARRGNGPGRGGPARGAGWGGPANGPGWGGPARGAGHNSGTAVPFECGNQTAAGAHRFHRSERSEQLLNVLADLARNAQSDMVRVWAAEAWLNRVEGIPRAVSE